MKAFPWLLFLSFELVSLISWPAAELTQLVYRHDFEGIRFPAITESRTQVLAAAISRSVGHLRPAAEPPEGCCALCTLHICRHPFLRGVFVRLLDHCRPIVAILQYPYLFGAAEDGNRKMTPSRWSQ
jgi:hypothetical protein